MSGRVFSISLGKFLEPRQGPCELISESRCTCGALLGRVERDPDGSPSSWGYGWCPKCFGPRMTVKEDGSVEVRFGRAR